MASHRGYTKEQKREIVWKRKKELIELLGGKCRRCGIDDIRTLDFHHKDSNKKSDRLKYKKGKRTIDNFCRMILYKEEIDNLELLCANCHRIETYNRIDKDGNILN